MGEVESTRPKYAGLGMLQAWRWLLLLPLFWM